MTEIEYKSIYNSNNQYENFFDLWTKKESVIKADGKGLSIPLDQIHIYANKAWINNNIWFLNEIKINPLIKCHLASNLSDSEIELKKLDCKIQSDLL